MRKSWLLYSLLISKVLILRQEADRPTSSTEYSTSLAVRDSLFIVFMDTFYVYEEYTCNLGRAAA